MSIYIVMSLGTPDEAFKTEKQAEEYIEWQKSVNPWKELKIYQVSLHN